MPENRKYRLAKIFRLLARLTALGGALYYLVFTLAESMFYQSFYWTVNRNTANTILVYGAILIAVAGFVISWWYNLISSILLIMAFTGTAIIAMIHGSGFQSDLANLWRIGVLFLLAGVFFFSSWWFSRSAKRQD